MSSVFLPTEIFGEIVTYQNNYDFYSFLCSSKEIYEILNSETISNFTKQMRLILNLGRMETVNHLITMVEEKRQFLYASNLEVTLFYENNTFLMMIPFLFPNLKKLNIAVRSFYGSTMNHCGDFIFDLKKLEELSVSCNAVLGKLGDSILKTLKKFTIYKCSGGYFEENFNKMKNLKEIAFFEMENSFTGERLKELKKLDKLYVSNCKNFDIKNTPSQIKHFHLSKKGTELKNDDFKELKNLLTLKIKGCQFAKDCFRNLSGLTKIKLAHTNINDSIFESMPHLQVIVIKHCNGFIGTGLCNCLRIRVVKVSDCNSFNYTPEATELCVNACNTFKGKGLLSRERIKHLSLTWLPKFLLEDKKEQREFFFSKLLSLKINNCNLLNDFSFLLYCKKLEVLHLKNCQFFEEQLKNCKNIKIFHVVECDNLGKGEFLLENVKELKVVGCVNFLKKKAIEIAKRDVNVILFNPNVWFDSKFEIYKNN